MEHVCDFKPGDVYEDCAFHPVLCTDVVYEGEDSGGVPDWSLMGVSLVDGSQPRSCSTRFCGPVLIPLDQVREIVRRFDDYVARRQAEVDALPPRLIRRLPSASPPPSAEGR